MLLITLLAQHKYTGIRFVIFTFNPRGKFYAELDF